MTKFSMLRREENTKKFKRGETIFAEEDPADVMYVVLTGVVDLKSKGISVNQVSEDEIFGEMALIDNSPRSATAFALTDCTLAAIDQKRFEFLIQQTPNFAVQVMGVMADRLRKLTELSLNN